MPFNSFEYLFFFLPVSFFLYFYFSRQYKETIAKLWLVSASLFFYSWWNWIYLPLILTSALFNYFVGTRLLKGGAGSVINKKGWLTIGIFGNLGLLTYFKYADFFIESFNWALDFHFGLPHVVLPLAISFFTFQQISFLVDSYKSEVRNYGIVNYLVFVTFFPQLIAGPIVHHREMIPQFDRPERRILNFDHVGIGMFLLSLGLFKKVVIADYLAQIASPGFDEAVMVTFIESWAISLSYTFQLYFDFSGYTDMAMGAAMLFNIKLPFNFDSPYKAVNIREFWKKWHMTLGRFFRDYVYIPLGGNQRRDTITYCNLLTTFFVVGLWHGAGWNFAIWGLLHGAAMVAHRLWEKFNISIHKTLAWVLTFNFINLTWVIFRAETWEDAWKILKAMIGMNEINLVYYEYFPDIGPFLFALLTIALLALILFSKNSNYYRDNLQFNKKALLVFSILYLTVFLNLSSSSEFLYFRF